MKLADLFGLLGCLLLRLKLVLARAENATLRLSNRCLHARLAQLKDEDRAWWRAQKAKVENG